MKIKDVKIGNVYLTKVGPSLVRVRVVRAAERPPSLGKKRAPWFEVDRLDGGKRIQNRTAGQLRLLVR